MPDANDMELVRQFARDHSEAAFTELVQRHLNLVYSVARRCTGNDGDAHDVTQAVFIILARKAAGLREKTLLTGWLYETTRFTAARWLRTNARRRAREQEAFMQSALNETETTNVWTQLAPHLESAMGKLNADDRALLVLRFYENKTGAEAAALLGIREDAAHKRAARAIEKLRKLLVKRGVTLSGPAISGAVSANSVQAAPVALAKTISAGALAQGAAVTTSTLTLVKGALKIMAWTKMKTAIVVGVSMLLVLAAGTITFVAKKNYDHKMYSWRVPKYSALSNEGFWKAPPQVRILPAQSSEFGGASAYYIDDTNKAVGMGMNVSLETLVQEAYRSGPTRIAYLTDLPKGGYDYIANLPHGSLQALQALLKKKFNLVGKKEVRETDVLALKLSQPEIEGFKPANSLKRSMNITNALSHRKSSMAKGGTVTETEFDQTLPESDLIGYLEYRFKLPVIDETGLTDRYDFSFVYPDNKTGDDEIYRHDIQLALKNQLGLALVATNRAIEMLVVERAP